MGLGLEMAAALSAGKDLQRPRSFELRHNVYRLLIWIIQALLDKRVGLFCHRIQIECGAARFSKQIPVQKRDGGRATVVTSPHYVLAGVLIYVAGTRILG